MSDPSQPYKPNYDILKSLPLPEPAPPPQEDQPSRSEQAQAKLDAMSDDEIEIAGMRQLAEKNKAEGLHPQEAMNEQVKASRNETIDDIKRRLLLKEMEENLKPSPPDDPQKPPTIGR